jgi:hypothetical protein
MDPCFCINITMRWQVVKSCDAPTVDEQQLTHQCRSRRLTNEVRGYKEGSPTFQKAVITHSVRALTQIPLPNTHTRYRSVATVTSRHLSNASDILQIQSTGIASYHQRLLLRLA